jgi:hypothetical protein
MLLLILSVILTGLGVVLLKLDDDSNLSVLGGVTLSIMGGIGLFICLLGIPLQRVEGHALIQQYHADKLSIENARREGASEIERATIFQTIKNDNGILAAARVYNNSLWFDWFIVDELTTLPPLE